MGKKLVAYFSATGTTKKVADTMASLIDADVFEIVPEELYTAADLDYTNKEARSTVEMQDADCRPAVASKVEDMAQYETVFLGFPIWWGREPSVIDTFLESYDFAGKTIVPFCTSGGMEAADATARIIQLSKAAVVPGVRLAGDISEEDLKIWEEGIEA